MNETYPKNNLRMRLGEKQMTAEKNNPDMARLNVDIFRKGPAGVEIVLQRSDSINHLGLSIVEAQALFDKMKKCYYLK